jgi:hypothetical protein
MVSNIEGRFIAGEICPLFIARNPERVSLEWFLRLEGIATP